MAEVVFVGGAVLRDGALEVGALVCRDGIVVDGSPQGGPDSTTVDATGLLVAPGFVDLQCNGGLGLDLTRQPAGLWEVGAALPRWGVTAWLPTVVTAPKGAIDAALAALAGRPAPGVARRRSRSGCTSKGRSWPTRRGARTLVSTCGRRRPPRRTGGRGPVASPW